MSKAKPLALKKLKGTYEPNKTKEKLGDNLPMMPTPGTVKQAPEILTDERVVALWYDFIGTLKHWKIFSAIDLPLLEQAFVYLQEIKKVNDVLKQCEAEDERYIELLNKIAKLSTMYFNIISKFGVSPVERSKLTLTAMEIKRTESILDIVKKGRAK